MAFAETATLVLTAIEFIAQQASAGSEGGVNATSDKVTYPQGLDHTDAPHLMVPFVTIVLTPDGEHNVAEVPLMAVANFGALGTYEPQYVGQEGRTGYEVANCQIALGEPQFHSILGWGNPHLDEFPLDITASADPTPVEDSEGNPAIQWVMTIKSRSENILKYGKPDLTIWARVGPRGNVELVSQLDRSEPDVTVDERGSLGIYVWARGGPGPFG
jgi:hypothetical protein